MICAEEVGLGLQGIQAPGYLPAHDVMICSEEVGLGLQGAHAPTLLAAVAQHEGQGRKSKTKKKHLYPSQQL